ncbi:MAG: hypothetical protein EOP82_21615, partial [Variovorax sp.]
AVKRSGAALICQVQTLEMAQHAVAMGADVLVAQGAEAGGRGVSRSTLTLVPEIVDVVGPDVSVVAAGGIADGRGAVISSMFNMVFCLQPGTLSGHEEYERGQSSRDTPRGVRVSRGCSAYSQLRRILSRSTFYDDHDQPAIHTEPTMPRIETPHYHRIDGLLFLADRPATEEEFLALIREAAPRLGIVPHSVEIIADGYGEPEAGPAREI